MISPLPVAGAVAALPELLVVPGEEVAHEDCGAVDGWLVVYQVVSLLDCQLNAASCCWHVAACVRCAAFPVVAPHCVRSSTCAHRGSGLTELGTSCKAFNHTTQG